MVLASTLSSVKWDGNGMAESSTTETIISRLSGATEQGVGAAVPEPWGGTRLEGRRCGWDTWSVWSCYGAWLGNVCCMTVPIVIITMTLNLTMSKG